MAQAGESFVNSIALTIRAINKINQITGGRESISEKPASGGSAISRIIVDSMGRISAGISEVGKGANVNTSA